MAVFSFILHPIPKVDPSTTEVFFPFPSITIYAIDEHTNFQRIPDHQLLAWLQMRQMIEKIHLMSLHVSKCCTCLRSRKKCRQLSSTHSKGMSIFLLRAESLIHFQTLNTN